MGCGGLDNTVATSENMVAFCEAIIRVSLAVKSLG
jgi:hypothetical protein